MAVGFIFHHLVDKKRLKNVKNLTFLWDPIRYFLFREKPDASEKNNPHMVIRRHKLLYLRRIICLSYAELIQFIRKNTTDDIREIYI